MARISGPGYLYQVIMGDEQVLRARILKQVEFYFGDSNLPQDKFLRAKVEENAEGWVDLSVICTFARMRAITEDIEIVKDVLKNSSILLELSEDGLRIRRKDPLPELTDNVNRTLYVSGIPPTVELDDIENWAATMCKAVETQKGVQAIRMLKNPRSKNFSGCAFFEMADSKDASLVTELFIKDSSNEVFKWSENIIRVVSKIQYFEEKNNARLVRESEKNADKEAKAEAQRQHTETLVRGRVAKAVIQGGADIKVAHDAVKAALAEKFPVTYVDAELFPGTLFLRFREAVASDFVAAYSGNEGSVLEISGVILTEIALPTPEEEQAYIDSLIERSEAVKDQKSHGHKKKAGRHFGNKRSFTATDASSTTPSDAENNSKKQRVEE